MNSVFGPTFPGYSRKMRAVSSGPLLAKDRVHAQDLPERATADSLRADVRHTSALIASGEQRPHLTPLHRDVQIASRRAYFFQPFYRLEAILNLGRNRELRFAAKCLLTYHFPPAPRQTM
jgi:hypothetical protein